MPKLIREAGEPRATDFVESLDRGLRLLRAFGEQPAPMSLSDRCAIAKVSTIAIKPNESTTWRAVACSNGPPNASRPGTIAPSNYRE